MGELSETYRECKFNGASERVALAKASQSGRAAMEQTKALFVAKCTFSNGYLFIHLDWVNPAELLERTPQRMDDDSGSGAFQAPR